MNPHGNTVLTPEKAHFNYHLSRARMITEGAFGKLNERFTVRFRICESKKEIVKIMGLTWVALHSLYLNKEEIWKFDLSCDHVSNKRRDRAELRDMLNLTNSRLQNYDTGRGEGLKVKVVITKAFWDEKK